MYSLWGCNDSKSLRKNKNCASEQKFGLGLRINEVLMYVNSLCCDNLLHLAQILTNLASLRSALNDIFRNV